MGFHAKKDNLSNAVSYRSLEMVKKKVIERVHQGLWEIRGTPGIKFST